MPVGAEGQREDKKSSMGASQRLVRVVFVLLPLIPSRWQQLLLTSGEHAAGPGQHQKSTYIPCNAKEPGPVGRIKERKNPDEPMGAARTREMAG